MAAEAKTGTGTIRRSRSKVEANDWLNAARKLLALEGLDAVRIERLARQLGITRGSFYWHFTDRDALLERILEEWRQASTLAIIERLESGDAPPTARLRSLLAIAFRRSEQDPALVTELSIRQWARNDERARRTLEEVDRLRLRYFAKLFGELGFTADEARTRAILANSFMRVAPSFPDMRGESDLDAAIALLGGAAS